MTCPVRRGMTPVPDAIAQIAGGTPRAATGAGAVGEEFAALVSALLAQNVAAPTTGAVPGEPVLVGTGVPVADDTADGVAGEAPAAAPGVGLGETAQPPLAALPPLPALSVAPQFPPAADAADSGDAEAVVAQPVEEWQPADAVLAGAQPAGVASPAVSAAALSAEAPATDDVARTPDAATVPVPRPPSARPPRPRRRPGCPPWELTSRPLPSARPRWRLPMRSAAKAEAARSPPRLSSPGATTQLGGQPRRCGQLSRPILSPQPSPHPGRVDC